MNLWQYGGKQYRITECRGDKYNEPLLVLQRNDEGDTGWLELARWRVLEDGPTFGGLANILIAAFTSHETSDSISKWARETFGPITSATPDCVVIDRAYQEWVELACAPPEKRASEAADVIIVLSQLFPLYGTDMQTEIDAKMRTNRARQWETNGDGTGRHK